jgi:hypothetical protein
MINFVLQYVHKTSVSVPSTSLRNGNSSRNAGSNFVLVFGILYQKSLGQLILERTKRDRKHFASRDRKERERSERKIDEIEEVFEKAKFSWNKTSASE